MILRDSSRLVAVGLVIGCPLAYAFSRVLSGFLFEVQRADPSAFVLAGVTLCVACAAAVFVPARRASSVDPMVALRAE